MYGLGRRNDAKSPTGSSSGCPAAPDPADFTDGGADLDLATMKADYASVLMRPAGWDKEYIDRHVIQLIRNLCFFNVAILRRGEQYLLGQSRP